MTSFMQSAQTKDRSFKLLSKSIALRSHLSVGEPEAMMKHPSFSRETFVL